MEKQASTLFILLILFSRPGASRTDANGRAVAGSPSCHGAYSTIWKMAYSAPKSLSSGLGIRGEASMFPRRCKSHHARSGAPLFHYPRSVSGVQGLCVNVGSFLHDVLNFLSVRIHRPAGNCPTNSWGVSHEFKNEYPAILPGSRAVFQIDCPV